MAPEDTAPKLARPTKLDIVEQVAKILSILAVPIVIPFALAFYSAKVQQGAQKETLNRDYVQLAVSILKERREEENPSLRNWAVDLLTEHSPTRFNPEVISALKSGAVSLPGLVNAMSGKIGAAAPDGKSVAIADRENVVITEMASGQRKVIVGAADRVTGLDFSADGSLLAIGDMSGGVSILKVGPATTLSNFKIAQPVSSVKFNPSGQIQVVSSSGTVSIFDQNGALISKMTPPSPPTLHAAVQ
jgi:Anaphase-promoting complex subunit 4 WD40 domain